jgi:hypothetical protein
MMPLVLVMVSCAFVMMAGLEILLMVVLMDDGGPIYVLIVSRFKLLIQFTTIF